jgi:hypothetical protein
MNLCVCGVWVWVSVWTRLCVFMCVGGVWMWVWVSVWMYVCLCVGVGVCGCELC